MAERERGNGRERGRDDREREGIKEMEEEGREKEEERPFEINIVWEKEGEQERNAS